MRITSCVVLLFTLSIGGSAAAQRGDEPANKSTTKLVTLVGCVASDDATPGQFTIVDAKGGTTYRLSGSDMHPYVGQRVQVTGASPRLRVGFGLTPSPNAAAQAGAIDPPPAAAAGTATRGNPPAPEFRVKSVRSVSGACPQK